MRIGLVGLGRVAGARVRHVVCAGPAVKGGGNHAESRGSERADGLFRRQGRVRRVV
jgi:hypothetical protein